MTDVSVVSPEDVNADGTVDIKDVYKAAQTYSSDPSLPNWSSNCDINNDNQVEMKDYYIARTTEKQNHNKRICYFFSRSRISA